MQQIYVDLDDVLSKTTCHYVKILEHEFGKTVDFEKIISFNLKESFSLTDSEYDYFFQLVHEPEIILALEPMENAVHVLTEWAEQGYETTVVTGRLTSTYEASLEWLNINRIPFNSFIIVDKYSRTGMDKKIAVSTDKLLRMEFLMAVEDSYEMASFLSCKMNKRVMLFDRPWNRTVICKNGIRRCMSWKEIEEVDLRSL